MAGRSDFTSILPRYFKKMIALGSGSDYINSPREVRLAFIDAHKTHKKFKTNRKFETNRDNSAPEAG